MKLTLYRNKIKYACWVGVSCPRQHYVSFNIILFALWRGTAISFSLPHTYDVFQATVGYSSLSLYFTLFLYVLSLPGLYSLVTRSVKVTVSFYAAYITSRGSLVIRHHDIQPVRRTYDMPGPANPTAKPLKQLAAEIVAYFKAMNYEVQSLTAVSIGESVEYGEKSYLFISILMPSF